MDKKDLGAVQKLFSMIICLWITVCLSVLMQVMKAGYVDWYLQDVLMQANLAALLIDPYHYGTTGELVFEDVRKTKEIFEQVLRQGIGDETDREGLGITQEAELMELRVYEVLKDRTTERIYHASGGWTQKGYESGALVTAPDGTVIENTSIYAKIAVPVRFIFGVEVTAVKEHCVDVVSEETVYG